VWPQAGRSYFGLASTLGHGRKRSSTVVVSGSMVFLVNSLVTHHFKLEAEREEVEELFLAWNAAL
jgi:hypothetical protein